MSRLADASATSLRRGMRASPLSSRRADADTSSRGRPESTSTRRIPCLSSMFAKTTLILWLLASALAPSAAASPARTTQRALAAHTAAHATHHRVHRAAAHAVERRLLLVAPRTRLLKRFVDRKTGLVRRNVTARCQLMPRRAGRRHSVYLCRVWRQPRLPSSGIKVRCRTKHKRFVVTANRRGRRH